MEYTRRIITLHSANGDEILLAGHSFEEMDRELGLLVRVVITEEERNRGLLAARYAFGMISDADYCANPLIANQERRF